MRRKRDGDEMDVAEVGDESLRTHDLPGPPSALTCPECGGALWELEDGHLIRYRCHLGHGYSVQGLTQHQGQLVEDALWTALRALEESASLRRRIATRSRRGGFGSVAREYEKQAEEYEAKAALIRKTLITGTSKGVSKRPKPVIGRTKSNGKESGTVVPRGAIERISAKDAKKASLRPKRKR
jgi:two-component system chemotaxis response regulator CheB